MRITRNQINKKHMIALGYCQCQRVLNLFGYDYKIGYNAGIYGWNYDLYEINGVSIVAGYNVPYRQYNNRDLRNQLIALDNKIKHSKFTECGKYKKEFFEIFR